MLYRRSAQVALQAAIQLALQAPGASLRVRELAKAVNVPATYLTKVLQGLTRAGLLQSVRGPGGGVQLASPATRVTAWHVVSAIEPAGHFERCVLGLGHCSDAHPCALHETWMPVRSRILSVLQNQTIAELARHLGKTTDTGACPICHPELAQAAPDDGGPGVRKTGEAYE